MFHKISIIIVCRNEEKYIKKCLDSVIQNNYPLELMEVLIIDGCSTDRTPEIVQEYQEKYPCVRLLNNPGITAAAGLNIGLKNVSHDYIIRLDSHALYNKEYFLRSVTYLDQYQADNVGGVLETLPSENTLIAQSIAKVLSSTFGVGNSHFRTGVDKPKEVDTVPFGCFRKSLFEKIGGYNENLKRCEDIDLNIRIKKAGGKIMLFPDIKLKYFSRPSLKIFIQHMFDNGYLGMMQIRYRKFSALWYHLVPLGTILLTVLLLSLSLISDKAFKLFLALAVTYGILDMYTSVVIVIKERDIRYLLTLPWLFLLTHILYGLGSICGLCVALQHRVKNVQ